MVIKLGVCFIKFYPPPFQLLGLAVVQFPNHSRGKISQFQEELEKGFGWKLRIHLIMGWGFSRTEKQLSYLIVLTSVKSSAVLNYKGSELS